MKKFHYLFTFIIAMIFAGCAKDGAVGPTGPNGLTGAQGVDGTAGVPGGTGPTGPAGSAGPIGATGPDGNITAIYSGWVQRPNDSIEFHGVINRLVWNIEVPQITADVLSKGVVMVYGKFLTPEVRLFPFSAYEVYGTAGLRKEAWEAHITLGKIQLTMELIRPAYSPPGHPQESALVTYRYVIIYGSVHGMGSINIQNYDKVKAMLHLTD
jgi:hypothetical protein